MYMHTNYKLKTHNPTMIGCIVQARIGSTRFPGKILKSVDNNETVLSFGIKQLKSSKYIDEIVVATTTLPEDDIVIDYVEKLNVKSFRGSSKNVLDRYYQCAKKFSFPTIVRITSDCPLIDPKIVDKVISYYLENEDRIDYVSNVHPVTTFPDGTDVEVFSFKALEQAWSEAKMPSEREHVTPYIYNSNKFRLGTFDNSKNLSNFRWTVDHDVDLELICELVHMIPNRPILMENILDLFSNKPDLQKINQGISNKEGYLISLKEDEKFLNSTKN